MWRWSSCFELEHTIEHKHSWSQEIDVFLTCLSHWNLNGYIISFLPLLITMVDQLCFNPVAQEKGGLNIATMPLWCIIECRPLYAHPLLHCWCSVYILKRMAGSSRLRVLCGFLHVFIDMLFLCSLSLLRTGALVSLFTTETRSFFRSKMSDSASVRLNFYFWSTCSYCYRAFTPKV